MALDELFLPYETRSARGPIPPPAVVDDPSLDALGPGRREPSAPMLTVELRVTFAETELLDAAEELPTLTERAAHEDSCPALRALLLALDDAIVNAFCAPSGGHP